MTQQPAKEARLRPFQYHTVDAATAELMTFIRERYYLLAELVLDLCPDSRERSLALTHLEESSMRAIQCLAITQGKPEKIGTVCLPPSNE